VTARVIDGPAVARRVRGEVAEVAGAITPVPGGVGPMTIAMLPATTLTTARVQQGIGD
jgi:5,10-methylene-tetrahydrofolate dehydrogenase/methenyl tetrahydrofolate cyclohydrolase